MKEGKELVGTLGTTLPDEYGFPATYKLTKWPEEQTRLF